MVLESKKIATLLDQVLYPDMTPCDLGNILSFGKMAIESWSFKPYLASVMKMSCNQQNI